MADASTFRAGARRMMIAMRDNNGYPMGDAWDANDVDMDTEYHAYLVSGYVSSTKPAKEVEYATNRSDGTNKGQIAMGISNYGTGEITLSEYDEKFMNLIREARSDTTISTAMVFTAANNQNVDTPSVILFFTDRVRDEFTGATYYETTVYHNAQLTVTDEGESNNSGGDNPSTYTVTYTIAPSRRDGSTGMLFSGTTLQVLEDEETHTKIRSSNPLAQTTWIADGVATTFALKYKPLSNSATGAAQNIITKNGVTSTVTSVNTTTGVTTIAAVGTAGQIWVVLYETAYRAV